MRTQAAILWEAGTNWKVEDIELDPPRAGEVLVRVAAAGLCHDSTEGMTALTGHRIGRHGYHRLCFVAGPKDAPDAVARYSASGQSVAASPDSSIDQIIYGDFSEDSGIAAARTLLGRTALPRAVVCANDQMT